MANAVESACSGVEPMAKDKEQQQKNIDLMSMLQCDTPKYDAFVTEFIGTRTGAGMAPSAKVAHKLCPTWPNPQQRSAANSDTASRTVRVGVMDSAFNPPHYCHAAYLECMGTMKLTPATAIAGADDTPRLLEIDAYLLLLGSQNADKELVGATLEQRMRMVDMLATTVALDTTADTWHMWKNKKDFDATSLHNMAIGMVNTPLFVDKCTAVRDMVRDEWSRSSIGTGHDPGQLEVLSYFAMGWDALIRFFDPKYYADYPQEIKRFFASGGRIAFSRRTGFPNDDVDAFFGRTDIVDYLEHIYELRLPKRVRHISSTDVRIAVRDSTRSVRDIPPRILEYVNSYMLYRD
ncbi:hypothetical protein LPJ59_002485 [Coemansia sp. RSA 2399]|nr:hypothetical protein LPJ59_002485 [Coemansia sp. RSA 2399]KAJ1902737.1 hypothetical protein LPJ81_003438 [Coemansia sp. IMI 209127]